jgi:hypothetical protein
MQIRTLKIRFLKGIATNEEALVADRTPKTLNARKIITVAALVLSIVGTLAVTCAVAAVRAGAKSHPITPEIKLVDDYNTWFMGQELAVDMDKFKAGLPKYITNDTVLHEADSLPWGGTTVGYDGWVHLIQIIDGPIFGKLSSLLDVSSPKYYQHGNIVLREYTMTIKPTKAAPKPFVMGIMEKYTVEDGRISQVDEFYADTAGVLERFAVLGVLPEHKK